MESPVDTITAFSLCAPAENTAFCRPTPLPPSNGEEGGLDVSPDRSAGSCWITSSSGGRDRQDVLVTKEICDADGWVDHRFVISEMGLRLQPVQEATRYEATRKDWFDDNDAGIGNLPSESINCISLHGPSNRRKQGGLISLSLPRASPDVGDPERLDGPQGQGNMEAFRLQ
ncbi:hypothetical protein SprV_0702382700 [Sparganum proliferum]